MLSFLANHNFEKHLIIINSYSTKRKQKIPEFTTVIQKIRFCIEKNSHCTKNKVCH